MLNSEKIKQQVTFNVRQTDNGITHVIVISWGIEKHAGSKGFFFFLFFFYKSFLGKLLRIHVIHGHAYLIIVGAERKTILRHVKN